MSQSDVKRVYIYKNYIGTFIKVNNAFPRPSDLIKNLSYSFTYLEYIEMTLKVEKNYVVICQLRKSYILTGMSIVEALLFYIIKSKGLESKELFKTINTFISNEQTIEGKKTKVESRVMEKLDNPISLDMNLDSMLKKAQDRKLLGNSSEVYSQLNHLRKLRNKIHLHISDGLDHDFNSFTPPHYESMKRILFAIVKIDSFKNEAYDADEIFNFLIPK